MNKHIYEDKLFLELDRFILININSSDHTGKVMSGLGDRKIDGTDS